MNILVGVDNLSFLLIVYFPVELVTLQLLTVVHILIYYSIFFAFSLFNMSWFCFVLCSSFCFFALLFCRFTLLFCLCNGDHLCKAIFPMCDPFP